TLAELGKRLGRRQLFPARLGGQQQAGAGTDRSACARRELDAKPTISSAHVVLPTLQVPKGQGAGALGSSELGAAFAGGVVQAQHLVAAAAVLAAGQGLALEAG